MNSYHTQDHDSLRTEIAVAAARMIAEDGEDYANAKRKAAKRILGVAHSDLMPDNAQIEEEVRLYNELFLADTQPQRLRHLRQVAIKLMHELERFNPYISGAVLNGTAGEHSDIHLQLFYDNPKDVEIFLLNKNVQFDVTESNHFKPKRMEAVETISFLWQNEGVTLALYAHDDLRGALKLRPDGRPQRANVSALQALLAEDEDK